jgi:membrane protease YdiL (CAAX protease family)
MIESPERSQASTAKVGLALAAILVYWLLYTALHILSVTGVVGRAWAAALAFLPGVLGVGTILAAGLSSEQCYLRYSPISKKGATVLVAVFFLALAAILPVSHWTGWDWSAALLYAPASGISQELFFRAAMLPALMAVFRKSPRTPLVAHAAFFALWHIPPLFVGAPPWAVLAVMAVPFLSGIGWGWQVQRDRTVLWAMIQHSLIWVVASPFTLNG